MSGLTEKAFAINEKVVELISLHKQVREVNHSLVSQISSLEQKILESKEINNTLVEEKAILEQKLLSLDVEKQELELLYKIAEEEKASDSHQKEVIKNLELKFEEDKQRLLETIENEKEKIAGHVMEKEDLLQFQLQENEALKLQLEQIIADNEQKEKESTLVLNALNKKVFDAEDKERTAYQTITELKAELVILEQERQKNISEKENEGSELQETIIGNNSDYEKQIEELEIENGLIKEDLDLQLESFHQEKSILEERVNQLENEKVELTQKLLAAESAMGKNDVFESNNKAEAATEQFEIERSMLLNQLRILEETNKSLIEKQIAQESKSNDGFDLFSEERKKLQEMIVNLEDEKKVLATTINNLEERIKIIKLAKSLSDTDEKSNQAKLRINELVREIDKCVSLLNR